jgi:hypothetical protein
LLAVRLGQTLQAVHRAGVALCDAHPARALVDEGGQPLLWELGYAACGAEATDERRGFDLAHAAVGLPDDLCRQALLHGYGAMSPAFAESFARALARL